MVDLVQTQFSRMFVLENRAGPTTPPEYQGLWKAGAFTWAQGDITLVRIPDPDTYGQFQTVDKISGEQGPPNLTITSRYEFQISRLLSIVKRGCDSDYQIHFGKCKNPRDFDRGWEKVLVIEGARPTNYSTGDIGAADTSERAVITEEVPISGETAYELKPIVFSQKAATQIAREVVGIAVCDAATCGVCGLPSDGCQVIFGVTKSSDASPGLVAELIVTTDGGNTWYDLNITSLGVTEDPNDLACVGNNVIVVSQESQSLHWAPISEVTNADDETASWVEVNAGFNALGGPRAISSASPTFTWIVGVGGYIYFASDPTSLVEVQDAGSATAQQLNAVHALDNETVVAVGAGNAVVYTVDGGQTWIGVTGPAPGVALTSVAVVDARTWWVGSAGGRMYYTINSGVTWSEKGFAGAGTGQVRSIKFANRSVGYMAHSTVTPAGRVFRTINGGFSWYLAPEDVGQRIPANDYIAKLATCTDPNKIYAAGLADDATNGIIVVGS